MNPYGLLAVLDRQARWIGSAECITGADVVARAAAGHLKSRVAGVSKKRRHSSLDAERAQELHGRGGQQVTDAAVEDELQRREAPRAAFAAHYRDRREALQRDEEENDQADDARRGEDAAVAPRKGRRAHVFEQPFLPRRVVFAV